MSLLVRKPLTDSQREKIAARSKPSAEDIQRAQDDLFLNLMLRVAELENTNTKSTLKKSGSNEKILSLRPELN
ncbi:MAG: hypothetical protein IJQ82_14430 [Selenomonadaceae bacterium]|nr:hypothetical protein [Selenomonadaceae bacterium]